MRIERLLKEGKAVEENTGMEREDRESITPRLPLFSTGMWAFHSEPPGMKTPPLNNYSSSVPFSWEEIPGKPKHLAAMNSCLNSPEPIPVENDATTNMDSSSVEGERKVNACRVLDGLVGLCTAWSCPLSPPTFMRRRRRRRVGWIIRRRRRSSHIFKWMWKPVKFVVSLTRRRSG